MNSPFLNQSAIANNIYKHRRAIMIISIIADIAGAVFYWVGLRKYEATAEFIIRNPLYGDRNNLYSSNDRTYDYFGNEEDIDKILLLSTSDIVQGQVIRNMNLSEAYKIDTTTRRGALDLEKKFNSNLRMIRTEFKGILLNYTDTDPERAAAVANETVRILEKEYGGFYKDMRQNVYQSIIDKIHEEDSTINALTDTLTRWRDLYGIYDIISPSRYNLMLGTMKTTSRPNYGAGVEKIQNIESLKDQLVSDRARQTTLANQYATGNKTDQLPLLKIVTVAKNPVRPKGPGGILMVIICGFLGFFFSSVYMLIYDSRFWIYDNK